MSSANPLNLVQSIILLFCKELTSFVFLYANTLNLDKAKTMSHGKNYSEILQKMSPCVKMLVLNVMQNTLSFQLFVSAMGPPGGGRNDITGRFTRHMNIISIDEFDDSTMTRIFSSITDWHFSKGFDGAFVRNGKVCSCDNAYFINQVFGFTEREGFLKLLVNTRKYLFQAFSSII